MPDVIKLLPDHVANQIAAGEVVQRPSSVVKELLENAIDAGAAKVELHVKDAGKTYVQVIDDGKGMSATDARMAFERHATSKINSADDLFDLHTKGFRGEALASIAAISHVEVRTKPSDDDLGTKLKIEGSKVMEQEPMVCADGTTIKVSNLFYNVPARRKFLKSDNVELRNITDEFHRVAMAHPSIRFVYAHNDSELFHLPPASLKQRITGIMGSRMQGSLVPVEEETELIKISGFIGKPETARKTRGLQFFFVNDRFIKHSYFHHAVTAAFEGLLKDKTHPSYFLYLDVPRESVDINIHPTKTEVKFDDEHSLYAIIRASVKHALGQYSVAPIDFNKENQYEVDYQKTKSQPTSPGISVDRSFNPFKDLEEPPKNPATQRNHFSSVQSITENHSPAENNFSSLEDMTEQEAIQSRLFEEGEKQETSFFQLSRKYIVTTLSSGLILIHQQRAHQRILYERLLQEITQKTGISQQLLFPLQLNMNSNETSVLKQLRTQLENTGFSFGQITDSEVAIEGIPFVLKESEVHTVLDTVIAAHRDDVPESGFAPTQKLAKVLARSMSIRSGETLGRAEMEDLCNKLFACKEPQLGPDQNKVFIKLTPDQLDSKFQTA